MIYITGDTHGDISCFKNPKLNKLGEKDILIVCGDFGFIWNPHDKNEKKNLEFLKKRKYTICFVDGAHENFDILNSYKPYRWKGGNTHKIADNIYHLMRGEIFTFEGKSFFVILLFLQNYQPLYYLILKKKYYLISLYLLFEN